MSEQHSIPSREEAEQLLQWAYTQNPGPWADHCRHVARAAETIARQCGLEADRAYVMGLMHDIGRYEGVRDMHHIIAGYELLMDKGYSDIARICLSHSFPIPRMESYSGKWDCTPEEIALVRRKLQDVEYDDYDKLIQLGDCLGAAQGMILIELRLMDVTLRQGVNEHTIEKWKAYTGLKDYFSDLCGMPVYQLFYEEICRNSIK